MKELTESVIKELFVKTGFDEKYFSFYETELKRRHKSFREEYPYDENEDEEERAEDEKMEKACIECANDYIIYYVEEREKGHSHNWANYYALGCVSGFDEYELIHDVLNKLEDKEEKDRELTIHAKSINKEPLFVERFKDLVEGQCDDIGKKAEEYCCAYRKCIEEGKSDIYAHAYAEAVNDGSYHSDIYASAYEQGRFHGMNDSDSSLFAKCCTDAYTSGYFLDNIEFFSNFKEDWQKEYYLNLWCQKFEDDNNRIMSDWEHQEYRKSLECDIKCMKYLNKL